MHTDVEPHERPTRPRRVREVVFDVARPRRCTTARSGPCATSTIEVNRKEITAFIGPSGCGKTTVLRCFNRMNDLIDTARVEGSITYHGVDLYDREVNPVEVRRRIGMVFQKPNPFPKSIYDNVAYGPKVAGVKGELDDIVERSLRSAALWDEVKDRLKASAMGLSGGQQQRLCIARAIAIDPEVLLMDEPCSALDPIATARIEDLMQELKDQYTIIIVTHNMQQAARVSDRTAFFTTEVERRERHPHRRCSSSTTAPTRCSRTRATSAPRTTSPAGSAEERRRMTETAHPTFHQQLDEMQRDLIRLAARRDRDDHARHRRCCSTSTCSRAQALIDGDDVIDALTLDIEERCFTAARSAAADGQRPARRSSPRSG